MNSSQIDKRLLVLMYGFAFVLLLEWLLPVIELTDTDHLRVFIFFILGSFLLGLFSIRWPVVLALKLLYIYLAIHYVFFETLAVRKETMLLLVQDLFSNVAFIANGQWMDITNQLRTILFFLLIWMTTYLIRYWIEVRKSMLLFFAMTVIYIAILNTFSPYNADIAIFRILAVGLLLIGLLTIARIAERHGQGMSMQTFVLFSLPLIFIVLSSAIFANFLPVKAPVWADPVPYITSFAQGGEGTKVSKSGYDENDDKLGGPFVEDDTLVFEADVSRKQYWRIETKTTYTTKGWEDTVPADSDEIEYYGMNASFAPPRPPGETGANVVEDAKVQMYESLPYLVYPYGSQKMQDDNSDVVAYYKTPEQYWFEHDGTKASPGQYEVSFQTPEYSLNFLQEIQMRDYEKVDFDVTPYLQLPDELPDRVRDLAFEITENKQNVYEKAREIESYFNRGGFYYERTDVAVPKEEDDYVDQFLFETKKGYCDNFSTSMVVLLRSIDIPARWVKGFAPGETGMNADGNRVYQITNNEAHSWVEAYFPEVGWVPFEPTIGFSNLRDLHYEFDSSESQKPEQQPTPPKEEKKEKEQPTVKKQKKKLQLQSIQNWMTKYGFVLIGIATFILIVVAVIFARRKKWMPKVLVMQAQRETLEWEAFSKQYKQLLQQLHRVGLKRQKNMTLSEFARIVDNSYGGTAMQQLTKVYEEGFYGDNQHAHDWEYLKDLWKDLLRKTTG